MLKSFRKYQDEKTYYKSEDKVKITNLEIRTSEKTKYKIKTICFEYERNGRGVITAISMCHIQFAMHEIGYLEYNNYKFTPQQEFIISKFLRQFLPKEEQVKTYLNRRYRIKRKIDLIKTYIIKDSHTGFYKIGKSKNPNFREKTLQAEKPTIQIVKLFDKNIEAKLHNDYKQYRVRGEWFNLTKLQVEYIVRHN